MKIQEVLSLLGIISKRRQSFQQEHDYVPTSVTKKHTERVHSVFAGSEKQNEKILIFNNLIHRLFSENLQWDMLDHGTSKSTFISTDGNIEFTPDEIVNCVSLGSEQAQALKLLYNHSLQYDDFILHVNLENLTWSAAQKILSRANSLDIENGVDLWSSVAMKTKQVYVTTPKHMIGFSALMFTLFRFLSPKIRSRVILHPATP